MAFQGSLKTIRIPELFSLIHQLRRTGILTLVSEHDERSFLFHRGSLIFATARDGSRRMGGYLVRLGLVTAEDLNAAMAKHTNDDLYFGQRLVDAGLLEWSDIKAAVTEQILDLLGEVIAWTTGAFHFDDNALPFAIPEGTPISTHSVILEATRRSDERSYVKSIFPDLNVVLEKKQPDAPPEEADAASKVLELVDGHRTLEQLLFASPASEQATVTELQALISRGVLHPSGVQAVVETARPVPELDCLPVAPNVPGRLFAAFASDGYPVPRIAEAVAEDPVLTAKLLRSLTVNGMDPPREKLAVLDLAGMLGAFQLRFFLLPEAIRGLYFARPASFRKECWEHSLLCAQLSQQIAEVTAYPFPDEAYLAGLLHNLGAFLLMSHDPERYQSLVDESLTRKEDLEVLEEQSFGISHSRMGGIHAEKWRFPRSVTLVIKAHHKVEPGSTNPLLNIVAAAMGLAEECGLRFGHVPGILAQYKRALKRLSLSPKKALTLVNRVPRAVARSKA
jgi:HD-like signal output (HDOD) protein